MRSHSFPKRRWMLLPAILTGTAAGFFGSRWFREKPSPLPAPAIAHESPVDVPSDAQTPRKTPPLSADEVKTLAIHEAIAQGKPVDWKAALDAAKASGDGPLCAVLIAFWADAEPLAARKWAEQAERYQLRPAPLTRIIAETWARKDPLAAMKGFVDTRYEVPLPQWRIFDIAAEQDMAVAKKLVAAYPVDFSSFGIDEAPRDFAKAAEAMAAMPPGKARVRCVTNLLEEWRIDGEKEALAWWRGESAAPARSDLAQNPAILLDRGKHLIPDLSPAEVAAAETALGDNMEDIRTLYYLRAKAALPADPAAAAAMALEKLTGPGQVEMVSQSVHALRATDPAKARQFAEALPSGADRDQLLESLSSTQAK